MDDNDSKSAPREPTGSPERVSGRLLLLIGPHEDLKALPDIIVDTDIIMQRHAVISHMNFRGCLFLGAAEWMVASSVLDDCEFASGGRGCVFGCNLTDCRNVYPRVPISGPGALAACSHPWTEMCVLRRCEMADGSYAVFVQQTKEGANKILPESLDTLEITWWGSR